MRLSGTNLVPVLAIIAGGVIGASLSFGTLLLWSPPDDVPTPEPEVTRVGVEQYDVSPRDERFMMLRFEDVEIVEIMAGPENARTGWSPATRRTQ